MRKFAPLGSPLESEAGQQRLAPAKSSKTGNASIAISACNAPAHPNYREPYP